jgi:hypothetical protein
MREAVIVLPVNFNDGKPMAAAHNWLRRKLSDTFGGFTAHEAVGGWSTGGVVQIEPVVRYVVACPTDKQARVTLRLIAADLQRMGKQEAIYLRMPSGDVEFIDGNVAPF